MGRPKGALGKSGKGKKIKDVNKPKRSTSAYFFFLAHCRQEAAKAGNYPSKIAEFTKECSEKWRNLTKETKKPFDDAAAEDKKRYEAEMAQYKGKVVDPNKPKRPPTAYFIFLADFRIKMANSGIEHKDLLRKAGEDWRNMSPEMKKPYEKKALEESKKYEEAMTEYRKSGGGVPQPPPPPPRPVAARPPPQPARIDDDDDEEEDDDEEDDDEDDDE